MSSLAILLALQARTQSPHRLQASWSMPIIFPVSSWTMASSGHTAQQIPHWMQFSGTKRSFLDESQRPVL